MPEPAAPVRRRRHAEARHKRHGLGGNRYETSQYGPPQRDAHTRAEEGRGPAVRPEP